MYQVSNRSKGEKESIVDKVFQQALKEFKENLVSTFSVASKQGGSTRLSIKYKDLIANFANIMETVCRDENIGGDFPTTMGVNAFRGFLNEFMNSFRVEEKVKVAKTRKERKKEKATKRQKNDENSILGHSFVSMVINIPTACEICSSFIMWPIERGVVCQSKEYLFHVFVKYLWGLLMFMVVNCCIMLGCKLACHKKCHMKIQSECSDGNRSNSASGSDTGIFGAPLASLIPENGVVPEVVENLITLIELYGLRTEGLYRKSGLFL